MKKEQAKRIVQRLKNKRIEVELREGYSGRGMDGEETTAIVARDRFEAFAAEDSSAALRKARKDQLGFGRVWY